MYAAAVASWVLGAVEVVAVWVWAVTHTASVPAGPTDVVARTVTTSAIDATAGTFGTATVGALDGTTVNAESLAATALVYGTVDFTPSSAVTTVVNTSQQWATLTHLTLRLTVPNGLEAGLQTVLGTVGTRHASDEPIVALAPLNFTGSAFQSLGLLTMEPDGTLKATSLDVTSVFPATVYVQLMYVARA